MYSFVQKNEKEIKVCYGIPLLFITIGINIYRFFIALS